MLAGRLAKLLWLLVHAAFRLWTSICLIWERRPRRSRGVPRSSPSMPRHVALIVCDRPHSAEYLARPVIWCLAAGIPRFTFYDETGSLKENEDELYATVEKLKGNTAGRIKWADRPDINGYKNGVNHTITVGVYTRDDGRKKIASLVRRMCSGASVDPDDVNVETVDMYINREFRHVPEPNLAVYCGELCCTRGLLPWHVRLTEFLSLGSHKVKLEKFVELLDTYSKCEQRYGK